MQIAGAQSRNLSNYLRRINLFDRTNIFAIETLKFLKREKLDK